MFSIPTFFSTLFLGYINEDFVILPSSSNIVMTRCRFVVQFTQRFTLRTGARKTWQHDMMHFPSTDVELIRGKDHYLDRTTLQNTQQMLRKLFRSGEKR